MRGVGGIGGEAVVLVDQLPVCRKGDADAPLRKVGGGGGEFDAAQDIPAAERGMVADETDALAECCGGAQDERYARLVL